jgi:hypothetical protein
VTKIGLYIFPRGRGGGQGISTRSLGGSKDMLPKKFLHFKFPEIASGAFNSQAPGLILEVLVHACT